MGGCASVDKMMPNFSMGGSVKAVKEYSLGGTTIELVDADPTKCPSETVVIPVFDGTVFDADLYGIPTGDKEKVEPIIKQFLSGPIGEKLKAGQVVSIPTEGKLAQEPYNAIKNVIFVPIANTPTFARDRLSHLLLEITKRCEEGKFSTVLIPRLTRPNNIGSPDAEIASVTAKTYHLRLTRAPAPGEFVISKIIFACSDKKYIVELQKAFNEATGSTEKVGEPGEGSSFMPSMSMPTIPGMSKLTIGTPTITKILSSRYYL